MQSKQCSYDYLRNILVYLAEFLSLPKIKDPMTKREWMEHHRLRICNVSAFSQCQIRVLCTEDESCDIIKIWFVLIVSGNQKQNLQEIYKKKKKTGKRKTDEQSRLKFREIMHPGRCIANLFY